MSSQERSAAILSDPLALPYEICGIKDNDSQRVLKDQVKKALLNPKRDDATYYFCIAERMKRIGDYRAEDYYEKAIQADSDNPNYELFYADYLRNFRGAHAPLFPRAENHYYAALEKVKKFPPGAGLERSGNDAQSLVERGLIALYQEDGIPLASSRLGRSSNESQKRPFAFLSTIDRYQQAPAELDREADIRDYTSEALFSQRRRAQSQPPLPLLGPEEFRKLIRQKEAFETFDRIRFRHGAWPSVDLFFVHRQTNNAQVTDFGLPKIDFAPFSASSNFNELRQNDFGVAADRPFSLSHYCDIDLKATFRFVQRWGLIEFVPGGHENIPQFDGGALFSRFVGPDKANLEVTYTHQWIQPAVANHPDRHRDFFGVTATYQVFRPIPLFHSSSYQNRFANRGWDFFAGFLLDNEAFIAIDPSQNAYPRRRDYFVGTSLKGFLWRRFDVSIRPTWFTSGIKGVTLQKNSQLRADATGLLRLVDEDSARRKGIPGARRGTHLEFVHLVGGVRKDFARTGLDAFENHKYGGGIDAAFYTTAKRTTYLASLRYDRERFFRLDRNDGSLKGTFSIGF
jgi:hypothetical protein